MLTVNAEFPEKLQCLFRPKRYKVMYGGRGAGRSWGVARALLLIGQTRPIHVLCARELQNSIDESVHKTLSSQIPLLGLDNFYDIQKDKIYGKNGTEFVFVGIKNNPNKVRSYEGIDYCWVEEANKVSKTSWGILLPTIRKKGSEIWITFNPELETDYTYTRFVKSLRGSATPFFGEGGVELWLETDDTIVDKMTWRDNPWFLSDTELAGDMEKDKERDPDHYLNVWEGHTVQALEGAVYAKELRRAQEEGRILSVPYENEVPVDTYWDLGRADNTAIWFIQRVAMQWRVLAYFENNQNDITHYIKELQRRRYVYGQHHLPHDAKHKKLLYKHSIEQILRNAYPGQVPEPVAKGSVVDGINAARMIMANCYFDEDACEDGLNVLRHYRYRVVEGQLSNEPLHDWASDGADAFRTFAMAARVPGRGSPRGIREKIKVGVNRFLDEAPGLGWMS